MEIEMGDIQLVNFDQIELLGGLEEPAVKEILLDFLKSFEQQLPELELFLSEKRHSQLREEAHKLKGAAKSCGFDALGRHAEELEKAAEAEALAGFENWTTLAKELLGATQSAFGSNPI